MSIGREGTGLASPDIDAKAPEPEAQPATVEAPKTPEVKTPSPEQRANTETFEQRGERALQAGFETANSALTGIASRMASFANRVGPTLKTMLGVGAGVVDVGAYLIRSGVDAGNRLDKNVSETINAGVAAGNRLDARVSGAVVDGARSVKAMGDRVDSAVSGAIRGTARAGAIVGVGAGVLGGKAALVGAEIAVDNVIGPAVDAGMKKWEDAKPKARGWLNRKIDSLTRFGKNLLDVPDAIYREAAPRVGPVVDNLLDVPDAVYREGARHLGPIARNIADVPDAIYREAAPRVGPVVDNLLDVPDALYRELSTQMGLAVEGLTKKGREAVGFWDRMAKIVDDAVDRIAGKRNSIRRELVTKVMAEEHSTVVAGIDAAEAAKAEVAAVVPEVAPATAVTVPEKPLKPVNRRRPATPRVKKTVAA